MAQRDVIASDQQYTPIASAYVTSRIHSQGDDLPRMVALAALPVGATVLDVGAGTGHTGLAFAAAGARITALDMTEAMLEQARTLAEERGVALETVQSTAEAMPFADGVFDAVACRYCAHHFMDVPQAIREMRRVLKPGGVLVFVDHMAPEDDAGDEWVNRIDWLRDQSHRREARLSEYQGWLADVGLHLTSVERFREPMPTNQWFARARTAPEREAEARAMLTNATDAIRRQFAVTGNEPGREQAFELHMVLLRATAV